MSIAALTLAVGFLNHAFVGFPKGYDAYGHMSKIKFLVDYFPNVDWNSEWYSGQFFSEGSFPPLFHYLGAILAGWFGLSLENTLLVIGATGFVVIACALYGMVRVATGNRVAALIAALLLLSTNAFWSYILLGGLYPRITGMAFLGLFGFFALLFFKTRSAPAHLAMVLTLAGALSSHLLLGAIGVVVAILMVAVMPLSAGQRLADAAKVVFPTALLVAFFYLPYLNGLTRPSPVPVFTSEYAPVSVDALLARTARPLESLPLLLVPVALVVPAVTFFSRQITLPSVARRLMPVLAVGGAGALVYALVGLPAPHVFIYNFQPGQALFFAAWFLAGLVGLAISAYGAPRIPRAVLPAIALGLVGFIAVTPTRLADGVISADNQAKLQLESALQVDPNDREHRIGVGWDSGSDWINARVDVPQTRGYQQQGVLHADWQYWLETGVWNTDTEYGETNFLLDWYAVRAFYAGPDAGVVKRFAARPDLYAPQGSATPTFDYADASPILSASSTRSALVIGNDAAYDTVFRALALADFDSRSLIPVRGGAFVDDHTASELRQFDLVVLYGYQARDLAKSMGILADYVQRGGNLLVEANNSPLETTDSAPAPIPGSSIKAVRIGPDWKLTGQTRAIAGGVDLASFAPAVYNGGPWKISYIPASAVAPWAQPVISSDGRPVVVAGSLGQGHVVWSGMNLPYHAASTRTLEESRLLANEISWAAPSHASDAAFQSAFVSPQERRVAVASSTGGVLFKENWTANWQATVNGKPVAIYRAGPDFMYVPLGQGAGFPATVEFKFTRTGLEWAGDLVSAAALIWLIGWPLAVWLRRRRRDG